MNDFIEYSKLFHSSMPRKQLANTISNDFGYITQATTVAQNKFGEDRSKWPSRLNKILNKGDEADWAYGYVRLQGDEKQYLKDFIRKSQ